MKLPWQECHSMPKSFNGYSLLDIWHNITEFDDENLSEFGAKKLNLAPIERKIKGKVQNTSPLIILKATLSKGYGSLSQSVLRKIVPLLKQGYLYNEAVLLANLKEALGTSYEKQEKEVRSVLSTASEIYRKNKTITAIVNQLIENYKGEVEANRNGEENSLFAHKDFNYRIEKSDKEAIVAACQKHFGQNKWLKKKGKEDLVNSVEEAYQEFFFDSKRAFRQLESLQETFENLLKEKGIVLQKPLYHHSNRANIYEKPIKYRNTAIDILPLAKTNAIRNPMFNKAMSILRKLINQLIIEGLVDKETEIIIEVARELNDNNKRIAIERFQKQREAKRNKIRAFLEEYRSQEKSLLNVEENIRKFELWDEQVFEETEDEKGTKIKNLDRKEILKENKAIKRYELWMEQKGQCMYTGKMISISQLFSSSTNIEHTIARELLPDNTMANKTIAFRDYNTNIKHTELPVYLPNFNRNIPQIGTAIAPRLHQWEKIRDGYKVAFETRQKPKGAEDEKTKNKRIQDKHFYKMHYDYWNDKLQRFTATDVTDRWARRQLTDTQNISKYAREFLKTLFHEVAVQKGSTTAEFRKMLGLEDGENPKDRALHTHHTVDAAVLTYIPVNASRRDKILKKSYALKRKANKQLRYTPHPNFDAQRIKRAIENNTLIYNHTKDNVTSQTFKKVRKAGKIVYKKDKNGTNILSMPIISQGDTIRRSLFKDSFLGKIRDVERFEDGAPKRNADNSDWEYKKGEKEFLYVKKEPISKITKDAIKNIIDPELAKLIKAQLGNDEILDWQGNRIRHVRVKKNTGKAVKARVDYKSNKDYKNFYYAESGNIPYGIMVFDLENNQRILLQVHAYQVAKLFREKRQFNAELFVKTFHPEYSNFKCILLRKGQRLIVLNSDDEYDNRLDSSFQKNRLYKIDRFGEGFLRLEYHLNAIADQDLDALVKQKKDEVLWEFEKELGLEKVVANESIKDTKERNEDYENRKYKFTTWKDYRINRLVDNFGKDKAAEIKKELSKFKKISSSIEIEGETPLLKLNTSESWNFLYEGLDFNVSILGELTFKNRSRSPMGC